MECRIPPERRMVSSGRVPLAVVVVDGEGLVSHWSCGARRLFGVGCQEAVRSPVIDLLPVLGALIGRTESGQPHGRDLDLSRTGGSSFPTSGRAHVSAPGNGPPVVLWWAYPLVGPGAERLLVLIADASRIPSPDGEQGPCERISPGFAPHIEFPGAAPLSERLPDILPDMGPEGRGRIVSRVLELGPPVLEVGRHGRMPVTRDRGR